MNKPIPDHVEDMRLLSDQEFVALMEAEHVQRPGEISDLEKQAAWKKIDQAINRRPSAIARPMLGWLTAVAAALIAIPIVMFSQLPTQHVERSKGAALPVDVVLIAYLLQPDGKMRIADRDVQPGETLIFKMHAAEPVLIGLALSVNHLPYSIRFKSELSQGGTEQLLTNGNNAYGYVVEPTDKALTFCGLNLAGAADYVHEIGALQDAANAAPTTSCATLLVSGGSAMR